MHNLYCFLQHFEIQIKKPKYHDYNSYTTRKARCITKIITLASSGYNFNNQPRKLGVIIVVIEVFKVCDIGILSYKWVIQPSQQSYTTAPLYRRAVV